MAIPKSDSINPLGKIIVTCIQCAKSNCKYKIKQNNDNSIDTNQEIKIYAECMDCNKKFKFEVNSQTNKN